jgi:glycosyltransferase involved in cell wall biosynthesis
MMISAIIPLLNEEESIDEMYDRLVKVFRSLGHSYEIFFIDDGSTDGSLKKLENITSDDSRVRVISFNRNFGKSAALDVGFSYAKGDVILTLDADLQDRPEEIPKFLQKIEEGYDLVSGWKYPRNDPFSKVLVSKIFNTIVAFFTKLKLHDFNCGFKAYRASAVKSVDVYGDLYRFLPLLVHQKGYRVTEIKIEHSKRKFGYSKFGVARIFYGFLDFLTVLLLTKYKEKPVHFFGGLGLMSFVVGFSISAYLSALWFLGQRPIGNRPLFFLGILLIIISIQLVSLGLLGEMVIHRRHKKGYTVSKKINV